MKTGRSSEAQTRAKFLLRQPEPAIGYRFGTGREIEFGGSSKAVCTVV